MNQLTGLKPLSKNTQKSYDIAIKKFEEWAFNEKLSLSYPPEKEVCLGYLTHLAKVNRKPASLAMAVAAIRNKCAVDGNYMEMADDMALRNAVQQYQRERVDDDESKGPPLYPQDMNKLLEFVYSSGEGNRFRDGAAFAMMWAGALRREEVISLRVEDVKVVKDHLSIYIGRSKGDQLGRGATIQAMNYAELFGIGVVDTLNLWLANRDDYIMSHKRPDRIRERRLFCHVSSGWLNNATMRWREYLLKPQFTTHSFRIGFGHTMGAAGVPMIHLQRHMRHKSPETTARYYRHTDSLKIARSIAEAAFVYQQKETNG